MKKQFFLLLTLILVLLAGGGFLLLPKKAGNDGGGPKTPVSGNNGDGKTDGNNVDTDSMEINALAGNASTGDPLTGNAPSNANVNNASTDTAITSIPPDEAVLAAYETGDETLILMAYLTQYRQINPETAGLITIPGTVLCHPLMQSVTSEGFYLSHDILRNRNPNGLPFLSRSSKLGAAGSNAVIYGHNIRYGVKDVFYPLAGYEKLAYYKEHPIIEIYTEEGKTGYVVLAYYLVDTSDEDTFVYWEKTKFETKAEYERYFEEVRRRNWLVTDIPVSADDAFITLSSCSMELAHSGTNRMVVLARKVKEGENIEEYIMSARMNPDPLLPRKLRKAAEE